jgi:hypothetical protein
LIDIYCFSRYFSSMFWLGNREADIGDVKLQKLHMFVGGDAAELANRQHIHSTGKLGIDPWALSSANITNSEAGRKHDTSVGFYQGNIKGFETAKPRVLLETLEKDAAAMNMAAPSLVSTTVAFGKPNRYATKKWIHVDYGYARPGGIRQGLKKMAHRFGVGAKGATANPGYQPQESRQAA